MQLSFEKIRVKTHRISFSFRGFMAMAQAMHHHITISSTELPSPTMSDLSISSQSTEHEVRTARAQPVQRLRRQASPVIIRTAFRNFSGIVEVLVGGSKETKYPETRYLVHKELLVSASPFFAAALNGKFTEGLEQVVRLPEEKPEVFEWFLHWLYTGTLTIPNSVHPLSVSSPRVDAWLNRADKLPWPPEQAKGHIIMMHANGDLCNDSGSPKYFLLTDIWALSDRLLTTQLSNEVLSIIARLSEATNSVPTPSDTWILYDRIRDNSPLRTLVLDLFAYKKTDKLLETHKDEWHPRFLRELVVKLKRPGVEAIERHHLVAWRPRSWSTTKACEGCKETFKPGLSVDKCKNCDKAYCSGCLRGHGEGGFSLTHDTSGCKPWSGVGICRRYHEHVDGESCV